MDLQLNPSLSHSLDNFDPSKAAQTLGDLLRQTPEYCTYIAALKAMNSDLTTQKLSAEMRGHQMAVKWGRDPDGQHVSAMTQLELELDRLPAVEAYRRAEREISALFQAVDQIISQELGLAFAANAQRSGCACSG